MNTDNIPKDQIRKERTRGEYEWFNDIGREISERYQNQYKTPAHETLIQMIIIRDKTLIIENTYGINGNEWIKINLLDDK